MTLGNDQTPVFINRDSPLRPDLVLVMTYIVLSAIGLLMIYSATAPALEAQGLDPTAELRSQAIFVVIGFIVFALWPGLGRALYGWYFAFFV